MSLNPSLCLSLSPLAMADSSDLRTMLRAADQKQKGYSEEGGSGFNRKISSDRSLHELAHLIGSISQDVDISSQPAQPLAGRSFSRGLSATPTSTANTATFTNSFYNKTNPPPPGANTASGGSVSGRGRDDIQHEMESIASLPGDDLLSDSDVDGGRDSLSPIEPSSVGNDPDSCDHSVVRFQQLYSFRGKHGQYLTTTMDSSAGQDSNNNSTMAENAPTTLRGSSLQNNNTVYLLGVNGLGVGDAADGLIFINIENKEDSSAVKYGQIISIKSPFAKERLLGLRDGVRLGFWRHLLGQGEKWQILRAHPMPSTATSTYGAAGGALPYLSHTTVEDITARGRYVRIGDCILLQTFRGDHLLSSLDGQARLAARPDRTILSTQSQSWQIESYGTIPQPLWLNNRPYLSGKYLQIPANERSPAPEVEARCFPRSVACGIFLDPLETKMLSSLLVSQQQIILMRELLLLFAGVEGQYLRLASNAGGENGSGVNADQTKEVKVVMDMDHVDRSTAVKVRQLFPLVEAVFSLRAFLKRHAGYNYGLVMHSLCSALSAILREFTILVAQLDYLLQRGVLQTLTKFTYLTHGSQCTLMLLNQLVRSIRPHVGGALLNALHSFFEQQGDQRSRELVKGLLEKAAEPFYRILATWIFRGEVADVYGEFFIVEDPSLSKETLSEDFNASYWDGKHRLSIQHLPTWLASHGQRILMVGKYLHVLRHGLVAGSNISSNAEEKKDLVLADENYEDGEGGVKGLALDLSHHNNTTLSLIDASYASSSAHLLRVLIHQHNLYGHLEALQRFFLLKQGDFFIHFMDLAEEELRKETRDISLSRLQHLLNTAIASSSMSSASLMNGNSAGEEYKDRLKCSLASHNLIQHLHLIQMAGEGGPSSAAYSALAAQAQGLRGVEAFTLDYRAAFPLSLVLSRRVITKYQLLSRLLYFSKHVERRLLAAWRSQQSSRDCLGSRASLGSAYTLRHRMLHFIQNFVYYISFEVIHAREHTLSQELSQASDMDQVMEMHERFLDICLKDCLLASQHLLGVLSKLCSTCLLFADHLLRFFEEATSSGAASIEQKEAYLQREASHETYNRILNKFAETFDTQLREFLDQLWNDSARQHGQLANLCVRLDYNGYYSSQFAPEF